MNGMRTGLQRRIDRAFHQMEGQHRLLREIGDEIDRAFASGEDADIDRWLGRFCDALSSHFELEEHVVFPAVAGLSEEARVTLRKLEDEHGQLLASLDELIRSGASSDGSTRIDVLARVRSELLEHERQEVTLIQDALGKG